MKQNLLDAVQETDSRVQSNISNPAANSGSAVDTWLKWAPLTLLIVANALRLKTKNKFKQQVIRVVFAEAVLNATMLPIKKAVNRERPNGKSKSFPSGHAATAFLSSQILYEELKDSNPAFSFSGYALSFVTAFLRLYHNKHWLSDVATGAILGVLSGSLTDRVVCGRSERKNNYLKPGNLLM